MNNYELRLLDIIENHKELIIDNPYITGMGYGLKTINNKMTYVPAITFLVQKKLPLASMHHSYRIPKYVNGVVSDVVESGVQTFCANEKRPAYAGLSVANSFNRGVYGTITYGVTEKDTKKNLYILSCSHVLSNYFEFYKNFKDVMQPAPELGGIPPKPGKRDGSYIGELKLTTGPKFVDDKKELRQGSSIFVDAGIAYVGANNSQTRNKILAPYFLMGNRQAPLSILRTKEANIGDEVWMITANSKTEKYGVVQLLKVVQIVSIKNKFMLFEDQIMIKAKSEDFKPGDSGAFAIYDKSSNDGIGMLVGSNGQIGLFTPINRVLDHFDVELVKPGDNNIMNF